MNNVALWLHNKLGTSNDSWISASICSQLNKETLKSIKDCFANLQTQVKMKLLLAFFHIPRRLVEEWKTELEEIIEAACLDSELWVSMIAETMKTFPSTGSLNTDISDYDETRPIFTDMVVELKRLVNKHSDIGMLPLECQYLNKPALTSVVGQQPSPPRHFTLKRKPKSTNLRAELLQKSSDAQSSLKKASAPTVPLRSRGMPRKMADTTPMRGIPSRVPSSGFRSPPPSAVPKGLSRTPAGRKEGGVKLLDIADQPLGYAAAKKRKRQMELEEQQKKALEAQSQAAAAATAATTTSTSGATVPSTTTPDYAAGLQASTVYSQPATPMPATAASTISAPSAVVSAPIKDETVMISQPSPLQQQQQQQQQQVTMQPLAEQPLQEKPNQIVIQSNVPVRAATVVSSPKLVSATAASITSSLPSNIQIVRSVAYSPQTQLQQQQLLQQPQQSPPQLQTTAISSTPPTPSVEIVRKTIPATITSQPANVTKLLGQSNIILTQKTITSPPISQPAAPPQPITSYTIVKQQPTAQQAPQQHVPQGTQMRVVTVSSAPTLTTTLPRNTQIVQQQSPMQQKIVQIKTAPTIPHTMVLQSPNNVPPLIPTQQPTLVNIQNMQQMPRKTVTITAQPQPQTTIIQQQQPAPQPQQTIQMQAGAGQQPKYAQVVMSSPNAKGKTFILANPNLISGQKNVLLRSGNTVYQLSGNQLSNIGGTTYLTTTGPPGLVKADIGAQPQTQQQIPALVPASSFQQRAFQQTIPATIALQTAPPQQQQQQPQQQTIIRPVMTTNMSVPQGLTLIQRPGQQPQLVQTIQQQPNQAGQQQIQRTIITTQQPQVGQTHQPTIHIQKIQTQQQQPTAQVQTAVQQSQQQPQQGARRGLSLSNKHVMEAHDMFKRANRVTRLDKALILGFMAGYRDNPRPNPDNVVIIKLNESKENVKQDDDTYAPMLVESLIRLDYNTGEWKTFRKYRKLDQAAEQALNQQQTSAQTSVAI